ncbi:MAG: YggT family protein [Neomegalonema sp.]|nr:YggT family protein [Neomegalonema sp.]
MGSLLIILGMIIDFIFFLVLAQLIIGLLFQFEILDARQQWAMQVYRGINQLLNPVLDPIRRILPPTGGLDLSPMVLLFCLYALQVILVRNLGAF